VQDSQHCHARRLTSTALAEMRGSQGRNPTVDVSLTAASHSHVGGTRQNIPDIVVLRLHVQAHRSVERTQGLGRQRPANSRAATSARQAMRSAQNSGRWRTEGRGPAREYEQGAA